METIHIYHTNDVHSHLEHWPRIHQFLAERKKGHLKQAEDVFLFDIGDFVDRWHPFSEATKGKGNTRLLNESGYTAVTIGNNEGINLSYQDLDHLYDEASFDVLVANFYKKDLIQPSWVKPFKLYSTQEGTRIAVIGLTAYFSQPFELLGWQLTEPFLELKRQVEAIKGNADVIILLSHLGINMDEEIAEQFPAIDVILGGHTHHVLQEGKVVNQTLIGAAGKFGNYVGYTTLEISEQKEVIHKQAILYDVNELPVINGEADKADALYRKGKKMLSQKITVLPEPLENNYFQATNFSRLLCEALREWCDADCAFLNAGLLLGPLSGNVTNFHLLTVCPHPINPCKVELSGKELASVLFQTRAEKWPQQKIYGLGFRGTVMGTFVYDQIDFNQREILIDNQEIDPAKRYSLAIPDMFAFGRFFQELYHCQKKRYYLPEFLRDLLKWKLQNGRNSFPSLS
ncbi:bifunctional UDP-sugar hydrolase/5'-nucleotidase [Bacillus sp. EB600]|uniref:bifunctional metallophosphatase/5'-nucleotidase n=1 Tax=Bacillus sp. EB600 TaxID=2806345 RepID=UPI00210D0816|nr:bifunctional UDP-sugar hydrolase/5'-nucleotidase [Bacillus sp. EB600]MCQ6278987.1 bifunctional metallophosphatase/5'-nucleotidase [Bacillus sp. EB600]